MFYRNEINVPIWLLIGIAILAQIFSVLIILALVLFISFKSKNYFAALLLNFLLFAVPSVLAVMGLDFVQWFSFYTIYCFTAMLWQFKGLSLKSLAKGVSLLQILSFET